jgi:thioredoxin reductase
MLALARELLIQRMPKKKRRAARAPESRPRDAARFDVVIAGAGPAGLSAALVLGRARRKVLICDTGAPRSWASEEMHAFLTRDGCPPDRFRALGRQELRRYPSVRFRQAEVTHARRSGPGFEVTVNGDDKAFCRKLLIATGLRDVLPPLEDIASYFGKTVFQCPYCDGWEMRDAPTAVYGKRRRGFELARAMTAWTSDIVLCSDGPSGLSRAQRAQLEANGIELIEEKIARLEGRRGRLTAVVFRSGRLLRRAALFFDLPTRGHSSLGEMLGCELSGHGRIKCGRYEATSVPGTFVAGNVIDDVQLAIVAAAEGARAAFGINRALTREDFDAKATGKRRIEHPSFDAGRRAGQTAR